MNNGSFSDTNLFRAFAAHAQANGMSISDPSAVVGFVENVAAMASAATSNPIVRYGVHAESLFEWTVNVLGSCSLVQRLDAGLALVGGSDQPSPDFLVVTRDGSRLIVEVKNCAAGPGAMHKNFKRGYLERLAKYAHLLDGRPTVAIYWASWHLWSLVDVAYLLSDADDSVIRLDFIDALAESEMYTLGDYMVVARSRQLVFRLAADVLEKTPTPDGESISLKITKASLVVDSVTLEDKTEQSVAWFLMVFGGIEPENTFGYESDSSGLIEFVYEDTEGEEGVNFWLISSMLARLYTTQSGDDSGEVVSLPFPPIEEGDAAKLLVSGYQGTTLSFMYASVRPRGGQRG